MKNNKGISFIFITFLMSTLFVILATVWQMGINDITLSKTYNDKSKSYYIAEAGVYYGGSIILEAVQSELEPPVNTTIEQPFSEYIKSHSFVLTITKEGATYRVVSEGTYNGKTSKVEGLVTISGGNITYSQMKLS